MSTPVMMAIVIGSLACWVVAIAGIIALMVLARRNLKPDPGQVRRKEEKLLREIWRTPHN